MSIDFDRLFAPNGPATPTESGETAKLPDNATSRNGWPPYPGSAPSGVRRLLEALWNAGYSIRLEPSGSGGWFILPTGYVKLPQERWEMVFELYERHHNEARDYLLRLLDSYGLTPADWNKLTEVPRKAVRSRKRKGRHV